MRGTRLEARREVRGDIPYLECPAYVLGRSAGNESVWLSEGSAVSMDSCLKASPICKADV